MILNNLDFNKLKSFQSVAQNGGLQEGARALNLTSSAVYQSIKRLEEDLQKHLFYRSGKRYILTDDGRELLSLYQKFLWDLSQFQELRALGPNLEGDLRVGLPLNFSKSAFMPVLRSFNELHPKVCFHLTIAETRRLVEQISSFELDFAVTDDALPPSSLSRIVKKELLREELLLVCSRDFHRAFEEHFRSPKSLKDLPHLDYARNLPLVQRWYKLHYRRQVKIAHFHSIDNVETMVAAILAGLGLGIIPADISHRPILEGRLHVVATPAAALYNQLFLVQEANYVNNNLMKRFLLHLEDSLSTLADRT